MSEKDGVGGGEEWDTGGRVWGSDREECLLCCVERKWKRKEKQMRRVKAGQEREDILQDVGIEWAHTLSHALSLSWGRRWTI